MALYDQGGGCACGLQKICDCSSTEPLITPESWKAAAQSNNVVITEKVPTKTTILLHSGNYFDFENFNSSRFTIEDVAHGLAMTCRFAGQCIKYYSVAEHSWWVSYLVPSQYAFIGLMHDASEAFLGDIPKPLKNLLPDYMKIEKQVEESMMKRFKIPFPFSPEIKVADRRILLTEQHQNMNKTHWHKSDVEPADIDLKFWTPEIAKFKFLQRFYELSTEPL